MTIGLILLAVVSILIFFGIAERFFRKIGLPNWLAFILVLALVVGAVVPSIGIGDAFSMNIGGFIVPAVIVIVLLFFIGRTSGMWRALLASIAVASVAVATRMLIEPTGSGMILVTSVIVGFVAGAVAYLIGVSRLATIVGAMAGIILGDVASSLLCYFVIDGTPIALGSRGVFDSLIIATVFGVLLCEAIAAMKRAKGSAVVQNTNLNLEAGADSFISETTAAVNEDKNHEEQN